MAARYARCRANPAQWASVSVYRADPGRERPIFTVRTPLGDKQIVVFSVAQAEARAYDVPFVSICFGNPSGKKLTLPPSPTRLGAHHLRCYDIEADFGDIPRMAGAQADALWQFVAAHTSAASFFAINCKKGQCRSPTAAAAIASYLVGPECVAGLGDIYLPNQHIY